MNSDMARQKKLDGHTNESNYAENNGGQVIKGNGKIDIKNQNGSLSLKSGVKTQWALYSQGRIKKDNPFSKDQMDSLNKWIDFIPNKSEWEKNPKLYSLNKEVNGLYDNFKDDPMLLIKYFCGLQIVDMIVITDIRDGKVYEIPVNTFETNISKSIKSVHFTKGGKFVIKGGNRRKNGTNLFELELRKGTSHKYVLFHSRLDWILDCVK